MAGKADFTADEWAKIVTAPLLAGMAVTLAEPTGLLGILKEGMASGRALLEARSDPGASALSKAVDADMETSEGRTGAREALQAELSSNSPAEIRQKAISTLAEVAAILDANAPQDAAGFKDWLKHIAERVAEASATGGFFGFGGVAVTDAEKATIAEIAAALKIPV
ncbi:MAG: hypothetical protein ACLPSF_09815 [Methylocella sp.]